MSYFTADIDDELGRTRISRPVHYTDGWSTYLITSPWRCRECRRQQERTALAWYVLNKGPFCTRCRNRAMEGAGETRG